MRTKLQKKEEAFFRLSHNPEKTCTTPSRRDEPRVAGTLVNRMPYGNRLVLKISPITELACIGKSPVKPEEQGCYDKKMQTCQVKNQNTVTDIDRGGKVNRQNNTSLRENQEVERLPLSKITGKKTRKATKNEGMTCK